MGNSKEYKPVENIQDYVLDTSPEHVWELEDELLKLRIENAFLKELRRLRLETIYSLRGQFKLKELLSYTKIPKATYMYWQKRLGRVNPDRNLDSKIEQIRAKHKNY